MNDRPETARLVHVVDDEPSIRRALDFLLRAADFQVQHWTDGTDFLEHIDKSIPACVLLDVRMPGIDGLEVQRRMAKEGIHFPVIVMTGHGEIDLAIEAMRAGAVDFLVKPLERDRLLQALAQGQRMLGEGEARRERETWAKSQLAKLTEREHEVLEGLACGFPNKTIAYDLGISSRTVEVYRANVMSKLDVRNFAEVLRIAFAAGLGSENLWREGHENAPGVRR